MAVLPCAGTSVALWGVQPQSMLSVSLTSQPFSRLTCYARRSEMFGNVVMRLSGTVKLVKVSIVKLCLRRICCRKLSTLRLGLGTYIAWFVSRNQTYEIILSTKTRGYASSCSSFFSQHSLHTLYHLRSSSGNFYHRRGSRLIVRAEADFYSILGVSKNASKSEIKSG
ncbi:hypothetical protein M8C21_011623 [Ambrosia artemisiifolia]|uniref:Uncharacterized protein n=1 Tax=Ambrosia artemisiifolia TaxID=4212 RepID=A0AAD5CJ95_AMBAR|nr:hypothetical protein M8C21_011623 [Ambrosia artemisiifolia]